MNSRIMCEACSTFEIRDVIVARVLKLLHSLNLENCMTQLRLDPKKVNPAKYPKSDDPCQTWISKIAINID
jgi:hypothetical protein